MPGHEVTAGTGGSRIARLLTRLAEALDTRPAFGRDISRGRAVTGEGFATIYREGDRVLPSDMPGGIGGSDTGPTPGVYGRAAVATCTAMAIRIAAERRGVALSRVTVDVEMDWDTRGIFGMDGVSAGPLDTRLAVDLVSNAGEDLLRDLVDNAMRCSPWLVALTGPHGVEATVTVSEGN